VSDNTADSSNTADNSNTADSSNTSDSSNTAERDAWRGKLTQKALLFRPDGTLLLTRVDHPDDERHETNHHWEVPGGTFELRETLVGGLRRELREEVDLDARVGPPVDAVYGAWFDGETENPMVSLLYRCETDDSDVTLNEEHDGYEWVDPETAKTRLAESFGQRAVTAVERAVAMGADGDPAEPAAASLAAVADPYADAEFSSEEMVEHLTLVREEGFEAVTEGDDPDEDETAETDGDAGATE
jgi:8-oxo-dGTP pyrophosphatase MutT (NUDIX family)